MEYSNSELLEETYKLAKANNKMLRAMRRRAWISGIAKIIFWAAMIGIPAWLYYQYAQPLVGQLIDTMSQMQDAGNKLQNVGGGLLQLNKLNQGATGNILNFLNSIPGLK